MGYRGRSLWFKSMFAILDGALPLWHRAFLGIYIVYTYTIHARSYIECYLSYREMRARSPHAYDARECASAAYWCASIVRHEKAHCVSRHRRTRKPESWTAHDRSPSLPARTGRRRVVSCPRTFIHSDCDVREFAMRSLVSRLRAPLHTHIDFATSRSKRASLLAKYFLVIFVIFHACVEVISKFRSRNFFLLFSILSCLWILKNFDYFYRFHL